MQSSPSTDFTASDGRRFAFPVAAAFAILAAILWWRDRELGASIVLFLGASLSVAGLLVPSRLAAVYRAWMAMALAISKVTTPIFMGIVYFGILTPTGLIMRALGRNPIKHRPSDDSFWVRRDESHPRSDLRRQF